MEPKGLEPQVLSVKTPFWEAWRQSRGVFRAAGVMLPEQPEVPTMISRHISLIIAPALLLAAPAPAQEKIYRSVDAVSGKAVRLGIYANVSKECTLGPPPEIKVVAPPKQGSLAVKSGKLKAGTLARCPKLEVPAQAIFYESNARFAGSDEVGYEVKQADGRVQSQSVKITVGAQAKPSTRPGAKPETTDL
jgi:hypothetical protein